MCSAKKINRFNLLIFCFLFLGTYFDKEENTVLSVPITEPFFKKGGWGANWNNPWIDGPTNAPFDQEFYLIINLAVGGTSGYFPDGNGKPYNNSDKTAMNNFWNAKDKWYPTWTQPFQIDSVKVWSIADHDKNSYCSDNNNLY